MIQPCIVAKTVFSRAAARAARAADAATAADFIARVHFAND